MRSCSQSDPTTNVRMERRRCSRGEASEPASEKTPKTAMSAPICAPESPCRRPATISTRNNPSNTTFTQVKSNAQVRRKRCPQSQRKPSASCVRSGACRARVPPGTACGSRGARRARRHRTRRRRGTADRARRRRGSRRAAERRSSSSSSAPARPRRPPGAGAGTTERSAPISAMLKNTYIVPSTNATIAICANESRWSEIATTMLVTAPDADDVGDDHHPLAVKAVDGGACEEAEERPREDAREADDARLDRRVRHREHEQRIGDPGRLGADRRERLPDLEQDEVAVLAEREQARSSGERGLDLLQPPAAASGDTSRRAGRRPSSITISTR